MRRSFDIYSTNLGTPHCTVPQFSDSFWLQQHSVKKQFITHHRYHNTQIFMSSHFWTNFFLVRHVGYTVDILKKPVKSLGSPSLRKRTVLREVDCILWLICIERAYGVEAPSLQECIKNEFRFGFCIQNETKSSTVFTVVNWDEYFSVIIEKDSHHSD